MVIMGLEIDSVVVIFCVILSFSGQVRMYIEVSSSLKYGVMQRRKPFDGVKISIECLERKKKMGLYVSEILFNEFEKLMIKMFQEKF